MTIRSTAYATIVSAVSLSAALACSSSSNGLTNRDSGTESSAGGSFGGTFNVGGSGAGGSFNAGGTGAGGATGGAGGSAGLDAGTGGTGGSTGGAGGSTGGTGGSTGGTGGSTGANLGKACTGNTECGSGLTCITENSTTLSGEGPAGGLCTLACNSDADCQALSSSAVCSGFGGTTRYCLEGCTQGGTTVDPNKCAGRQSVGCGLLTAAGVDGGTIDSGAPVYACQPLCGSDSDCGSGQHCDLRTGFCASTASSGNPIGTPCNPQAIRQGAPDPCAGICLGIQGMPPDQGACSALCVLGTIGCGSVQGQNADAACLFVLSQNEGPGDVGACAQLCDCDSQCLGSGEVCSSLSGTGLDTATGRAGVCMQRDDAGGVVGISTCP